MNPMMRVSTDRNPLQVISAIEPGGRWGTLTQFNITREVKRIESVHGVHGGLDGVINANDRDVSIGLIWQIQFFLEIYVE